MAPFDEARQLDHWWVGGDHALLALLAKPSLASETLEALGITYAMVAERVRGWNGDLGEREEGLSPSPAFHALKGRADAFAAVDGAQRPKPEHWLIALVWDDSGIAVSLLHNMGASQIAIIDELRHRGVRVPHIDPPLHRPWRGEHEIVVAEEELQPLIDVLRQEHPPGSEWRWGFNWTRDEPRRAMVIAEDGVDLEAALHASRGDTD